MDAREIVSTLASSSQISSPVRWAEEGTFGGRRGSPLLSSTGEGWGELALTSRRRRRLDVFDRLRDDRLGDGGVLVSGLRRCHLTRLDRHRRRQRQQGQGLIVGPAERDQVVSHAFFERGVG